MANAVIQYSFKLYRIVLKPALRIFSLGECRFYPTCSCYAESLMQRSPSTLGKAKSLAKIAYRILRCNAWITPTLSFDPPYLEFVNEA